jgi:hypothetical protein
MWTKGKWLWGFSFWCEDLPLVVDLFGLAPWVTGFFEGPMQGAVRGGFST